MTAARKGESSESGPPSRIPEGAPTPYSHPDQQSWMLQSIGEMRESIGALKQAVETLTNATKDQGAKLDGISHKVYAATVISALALAGIAWILRLA